MNNPLRTEVFVSYSHRDDIWREELLYTLSPYLQRERTNVSVWADRDIKPGDKWDQEIRQAIGRARVAVLLVSKYFLASSYIKNQELPLIFSMQEDGLRIVWVPISACLYTETELNSYQAVFDPKVPLDARNTSDQQKALVKVCQAIREAFQNRPAAQRDAAGPGPLQVGPSQIGLVERGTGQHSGDRSPGSSSKIVALPATAADQSVAQGLLFCVMAVQNEWIDPVQMSKACSEWAADKSKSLPEILIERKWISADDRVALEAMLKRSLSRHAGDAEMALLRSGGGYALQVVEQSQIPELQRSLDRLAVIAAADEQPSQWTFASNNRYQWQALHAAGSFSQVYSGVDRNFNRPVALKTTHAQLSADVASHHHRRLIAEAQIAGQLEHPHIVPVYDLAQRDLDEEPFYVMRMLRGPTLADEIKRHHEGKVQGRLDALERRRLIESLLCVCHAMEYAHARGVMHLDLKPQNVALGDYREVYLLDWGLSRPVRGPSLGTLPPVSLNDTLSSTLDETQGAIGTPAYMSPEQARGELDNFEPRTDVYGLGGILYEILTGRPPHTTEDIENDYENIRTKPVPRVRDLAEDVPAMIAEICDKAVAFEAEDRQATVEDLAIELRRYLDDEPLLVYRANVEHFEALLSTNPDRHDFREGIARNLFNLGLIQNGMLRHAAAENSLNKALEHYKLLVEKFPRDPRLRSELAVVWLHLYFVLTDARKFKSAEVAKRNALEEYQRLPSRDGYLKSILSRLDCINEELSTRHPQLVPRLPRPDDRPGDGDNFLPNAVPVGRSNSRDSQPGTVNVQGTVGAAVPRNIQPTDNPDVGQGSESDVNLAAANLPEPMDFATLAPALFDEEREFGEAVVGPRYRILRLFAEGGLGTIYVAYDEALHREVALKELSQTHVHTISLRDQFLKEARITALLDHPGIIPIYSLGTYSDERPFYAMKLIKGKNLRNAIQEWHAQPNPVYVSQSSELRMMLTHLIAACKTLAYAHARGIVHCDVKPNNILLGSFGETFVIDWGSSRTFFQNANVAMGEAPSDRYGEGSIFGTVPYMSPEQARGNVKQINALSDIYSLGATLFEVLVGEVPGPSPDVTESDHHPVGAGTWIAPPEDELSSASLPAPPPPGTRPAELHKAFPAKVAKLLIVRSKGEFDAPRILKPAIPESLEAICLKAMAFRPEDRYVSALDLAEDLERWLTGTPTSVE